jgi:hypothetical protein
MTDPRIDYLVNPFMDLVNRNNFDNLKNKMHIFTGVTGQGKTHSCLYNWIPKLFEKKELVIYSVPEDSVREDKLFNNVAFDCRAKFHSTKSVKTNKRLFKNVIEDLNNGYKVMLTINHQSLSGGAAGKEFGDWIVDNKINCAVIVDEAHLWTVSCFENYKNVTGNTPSNYDAVLFKWCMNISNVTSNIFGITATPNAEHLNKINPAPGMEFSIANEFCPKEYLIGKSAWLDTCDLYEKENAEYALQNALTKFINRRGLAFQKQTMMIQCAPNIDGANANPWTIEYTKEKILSYLNDNQMFDCDEPVVAIMTSEDKAMYSLNGSRFVCSDGDEEIKENLRDPDHPLTFLMTVEKGKCGMDIHNLSAYFSFRWNIKRDSNGEEIIISFLQQLGRFVRLNPGIDLEEYDLTEYARSIKDNSQSVNQLIANNSFDVYLPKTTTWNHAVNVFKQYYCSTVIQGRSWIASL